MREGGEERLGRQLPTVSAFGSRSNLAGSRESLPRDGIPESQGTGSRPAQGRAQTLLINIDGPSIKFQAAGTG